MQRQYTTSSDFLPKLTVLGAVPVTRKERIPACQSASQSAKPSIITRSNAGNARSAATLPREIRRDAFIQTTGLYRHRRRVVQKQIQRFVEGNHPFIFVSLPTPPSESQLRDESGGLSVDFSSTERHIPGMSTALQPKPRIIGPKVRICIVASKYNEKYTDALVENAIEELGELVPQGRVDLIRVPGAFEIPVMVACVLERDPPACVIALGLIIRGSTEHADLVASSITDSLQQLAIKALRPVIHEVLLVEDEKQAYARCIGSQLNRGREAARAATSMIDIFQEFDRAMPRNTSLKKHRNA